MVNGFSIDDSIPTEIRTVCMLRTMKRANSTLTRHTHSNTLFTVGKRAKTEMERETESANGGNGVASR